jgi:acyl-CoA synthetase (AMP-forming)/AMP-acid ligase II
MKALGFTALRCGIVVWWSSFHFWGEEIKAVVAFKPGQSAAAQEIIDYCEERLAAYKYPRSVEIRDTLPKTATGKILKRTEVASSRQQAVSSRQWG